MGSSWLLPLTSDVGWLLSAVLSVLVAATCTQRAGRSRQRLEAKRREEEEEKPKEEEKQKAKEKRKDISI